MINLQKGENISLSKEDSSLEILTVGLGWNVNVNALSSDFDLDVTAFLLNEDNKVRSEDDMIYYGDKSSVCKSVSLSGDNRTGSGEGDDESLTIKLNNLTQDVKKVAVVVNIYQAQERNQNFGQVDKAYIRCVNAENKNEIARFDLTEDYSGATSIVFGEIYRHGTDWKFKALGNPSSGGLKNIAQAYGLNVG